MTNLFAKIHLAEKKCSSHLAGSLFHSDLTVGEFQHKYECIVFIPKLTNMYKYSDQILYIYLLLAINVHMKQRHTTQYVIQSHDASIDSL